MSDREREAPDTPLSSERIEQLLDEALEETFPASDPPALGIVRPAPPVPKGQRARAS